MSEIKGAEKATMPTYAKIMKNSGKKTTKYL